MEQPASVAESPRDELLPPVEPPSGGFVLGLFVIPAVIVTVVVVVWAGFHWLAFKDENPHKLAESLKVDNAARWQNASSLADILRTPSSSAPSDPQLAETLAKTLDEELARGTWSEEETKLRGFLCKALGEFKITTGLPVLLEAATIERDLADVDRSQWQARVQRSAIEGLAALANNAGRDAVLENPATMPSLLASTRGGPEDWSNASAGAYALGVLGGPEALDRLAALLEHGYPNVRHNAATGLARHGDPRGATVLMEMLDRKALSAHDPQTNSTELIETEQDVWNRIQTALAAIRILSEQDPSADLSSVETAIRELLDTDPPPASRIPAQGLLRELEARTVRTGC